MPDMNTPDMSTRDMKAMDAEAAIEPGVTPARTAEKIAALLAAPGSADFKKLGDLADVLSPTAPGLTGILRSSAVRTQVDIHARLDAEAVLQQSHFMHELTSANIALMATGVLSGLVLAAGTLGQGFASIPVRTLSLVLGGATLCLGAWAAMLTYKARESDRLARWLGARGAAEMARITAFQTIATEAAARDQATAGAALALVRAHLLDDQRTWLQMRAARHRRSSEASATWGGAATGLAFIGGSGAVIAGFQPDQTWLAVAGVFGAAIGAYAVNREGLRRDRANADRYEKAAIALDALAGRFDTVARDVGAGKLDALTAYTTAITEQLAGEHKQWLDGTTQAEGVIAKLDAELRKIGSPATK